MPKRRAIWIFVILILLYPLSYLVTSRSGLYQFHGNLPSTTLEELLHHDPRWVTRWEPFPVHYGAPRKAHQAHEALHQFFNPLVRLDRSWWHRDEKVEGNRFKINPKDFKVSPSPTSPSPTSPIPAMPFPVKPPTDTHDA